MMITEWQRVRLRPDVDVPSLERFLEEFPADVRPVLLRHFEPDILPASTGVMRNFSAALSISGDDGQAEERVRMASRGADYLRISLDDERSRALYERIFVARSQLESKDLLLTRIPYVRWPRVYIDAPAAPNLDDFAADPDAVICRLPDSTGVDWLTHVTTSLPKNLGRLLLRLPSAYQEAGQARGSAATEGYNRVGLGTWRALAPDHENQQLHNRTISLWISPKAKYPIWGSFTSFVLAEASECKLEMAQWCACAISCVLLSNNDRRAVTFAYWPLARDLWIQALWMGPAQAQHEAIAILASAELLRAR